MCLRLTFQPPPSTFFGATVAFPEHLVRPCPLLQHSSSLAWAPAVDARWHHRPGIETPYFPFLLTTLFISSSEGLESPGMFLLLCFVLLSKCTAPGSGNWPHGVNLTQRLSYMVCGYLKRYKVPHTSTGASLLMTLHKPPRSSGCSVAPLLTAHCMRVLGWRWNPGSHARRALSHV